MTLKLNPINLDQNKLKIESMKEKTGVSSIDHM